jgi:HSP20 family molecular chaperone IbpA
MMLVRTRPLFSSFDDYFDRMFDQLTGMLRDTTTLRTPVIDSSWHDGTLTLSVDLPGVPDDAIHVDVAGRVLTISVRTDSMEWSRSMTLGDALDPEQVTARYEYGRLTITVAPAPDAQKRVIPVQTVTAAIETPATAAVEAGEAPEAKEDEKSAA